MIRDVVELEDAQAGTVYALSKIVSRPDQDAGKVAPERGEARRVPVCRYSSESAAVSLAAISVRSSRFGSKARTSKPSTGTRTLRRNRSLWKRPGEGFQDGSAGCGLIGRVPPNGSRLSCGRNGCRRKVVGDADGADQARQRNSSLLGRAPASFKRLLGGAACITLSDMKTSALTIRLDPDLNRQLARQAKRTGRSRSDVAREALRRQLAVAQFEELRRRVMPLAEARGYLTDEDVFRDVS